MLNLSIMPMELEHIDEICNDIKQPLFNYVFTTKIPTHNRVGISFI